MHRTVYVAIEAANSCESAVIGGKCMIRISHVGAFALFSTAAIFLVGCNSEPPPAPAVPSVSPDALVGRWGLASYHNDKDRARTEKEARGQCNKPYVITRGPNGGVMMYLADQPQAQELVLKAASGGRTFVGPAGDPGGPDDRELSAVDEKSFTATWVDPDFATRYGTMVFERCGGKA
jgi:hypothetical protein